MRPLFHSAFVTSGVVFLLLSWPKTAGAASLQFSPPQADFSSNCQQEIKVILDKGSAQSNAADIEIHFNPDDVIINDSLPDLPGVQVKPGNAYNATIYNSVDNAAGIIKVVSASLADSGTGDQLFFSINFTSKPQRSSANFNIYFTGTGNTLDSNVASTQSGQDLLTSVTNGHYTFKKGPCVAGESIPLSTGTPLPQADLLQPASAGNEPGSAYDIFSVYSFMSRLAEINSTVPVIGLLPLLSLVLNLQSTLGIGYFIWAFSRSYKIHRHYTGVIYNKESGSEITQANLRIFDNKGKEIAETQPDRLGRYYFPVKPGEYTLNISAPNFKEVHTTIHITASGQLLNCHFLEYRNKRHHFSEWRKRLNTYFIKDSLAFAVIAYFLATLALIMTPTTIVIVIFAIDITILFLAAFLKFLAATRLD